MLLSLGAKSVVAPKVAAIDTTGAGDVFAGALAAGLVAGQALTTAATTAVHTASTATTWPEPKVGNPHAEPPPNPRY